MLWAIAGVCVEEWLFRASFINLYTIIPLWTDFDMNALMRAVIDEKKSVHEAAEKYGVPRSTLGDRISG